MGCKERTYSLFDILVGLPRREVRRCGESGRSGRTSAAVGERVVVLAELTHRFEDELEAVLELGLVRCCAWETSANSGGGMTMAGDILSNNCHSQAVRESRVS